MPTPARAVVLVGGHPYDDAAFAELLASLDDVVCEVVAHPEAADLVADPERICATADVLVHYDMAGLRFRRGELPELLPTPPAVVAGYESLWATGFPMVVLHHAVASWPTWAGWAEAVGARFHYVPSTLRGEPWPDSGYCHDVAQRLTPIDAAHPMAIGLDRGFDLTDETYLCPVLTDRITPVLATDAPLDDRHTWSAARAVTGHRNERTGWRHPPGVGVAAWTTTAGRSPVAVIQPGDGPGAFANPAYRRLVANAIAWAVAHAPAAAGAGNG
jgi:uncharacterized protein